MGRPIPIHVQDIIQLEEITGEVHIKQIHKCTSDCFIAPRNTSTVKRENSLKLALNAKPINRQLFKNKHQMLNVDELLDGVSQIVTSSQY